MDDQNYGTGSDQSAFSQVVMDKMCNDMNFVGLVYIILGAISCLGIITAAVGIPQIFSGIRLREAVDNYRSYQSSQSVSDLYIAFEKQQKSFFIQKVLYIVMFVLIALYIVLIIGLIATIGLDKLGGRY